jgi:hypothetical protein
MNDPLRGISEIRHFFPVNRTPVSFVGPTLVNLLRRDRVSAADRFAAPEDRRKL